MSRSEIDAAVASWVAASNDGNRPGLENLYADDARVLPLTYPGDVPDDRGKCTLVWSRAVDGSWRVVEDMFSSSLPTPTA